MKYLSLQIKGLKELVKSASDMIEILKKPVNFSNTIVSIDIEGYLKKNSSKKIEKIEKKLNHLRKIKISWPQLLPPPDDLSGQLIYPTSDTVSIFKNMALNGSTKSIDNIYKEFCEMTDQSEELEILLDHAFDYGWSKMEFPFLCMNPAKINLFLETTPNKLKIEYVPREFMDVKVNELQERKWPYSSVVDILQTIVFEINPFKMAKIFDSALKEIIRCVNKIIRVDLDFDSLFSLFVLSLMASGILAEERILVYVSQLSLIDVENMQIRVGSTYAASALNHILSLNNNEDLK